MSSYKRVFFFFFLVNNIFFSCNQDVVLPSSNGSTNDFLVICDSAVWKANSGKAIRANFSRECIGLPQSEPEFDVIHLKPKSFNQVFKRYRNIFILKIGKNFDEKIQFLSNKWAKNQYVCIIYAKSRKSFLRIIKGYGDKLFKSFKEKEMTRLSEAYLITLSENNRTVKEKFNLKISLDDLFILADSSSNFIWFRKNKQAGQHNIYYGVLIYKIPFLLNKKQNTLDSILAWRDKVTKKAIQGGVEGSYMHVYKEYSLTQDTLFSEGKYLAISSRGLWKMSKGFMGGPFLNYLIINPLKKEIISLDGFIYAPKFNKRDLLFELEAILRNTIDYENKNYSSHRK